MLNDAQQAGHPAKIDFSLLSMPILVISTEDDRFVKPATARKIADIMPHAELTNFPNGGHIWLGHDNQVAKLVHLFSSLRGQQSA